jgi:5-methylthioadenosine/S-adenosylhomocysteine deaminase
MPFFPEQAVMKNIDTLINARWVIPVNDDRVLEQHAIAIDKGVIVDLLPSQQATQSYKANKVHHLDSHALLPGFVNTHTHTPMSLLRGYADDMPLMSWLNQHIWPAESKFVNEDFCHDGTLLAVTEMIRGGTTCFSDMYFFPEQSARVARQTGIRAMIGMIVLDFPTVWGDGPDHYLEKGLQLFDELKNDTNIRLAFAPHAPYTISDGPLERIATLSSELDLPVHMHLHETHDEIVGSLEQYGERPLQRMDNLGLLSPQMIAIHMTQLTDDEIELVSRTGTHIVHCPESNLKLASGLCPVDQLTKAGINVAIGTDGAASNNDLDMLAEMRTAALLAKGVSGDARALPAMEALRAATLNGARALGMDEITGSIEVGKQADVIAIDLSAPSTQPCYDPVSQIVYAAGRDQVTDVWVSGKQLLSGQEFTTIDKALVAKKARDWHARISHGR